MSEESRKKISDALKGSKRPTTTGELNPSKRKEVREKLSITSKGNKGRKGQILSEEHKQRISASLKRSHSRQLRKEPSMTISLDDMADLARALVDADAAVASADERLKELKEKARALREETIPSAMQELGLEEVKLNTGQKISIKQDVYASIPAAEKAAAFQWLNDNGFGGLIKIEVIADYGRGEQEQALALMQELRERGIEAEFDQGVHAQTLKAFLREQIAKGAAIPLDLFGARPVWTTKITNK